MMIVRTILFFFTSLLTLSATAVPQIVQTARERAEILHLIRKEKLDLILPDAMRVRFQVMRSSPTEVETESSALSSEEAGIPTSSTSTAREI